MKHFILCALALGLPWSLPAQQNGNSLLGRLPDPPSGVCGLTAGERQAYLDQVDAVAQDISAALETRHAAQEAHVQQNRPRWEKQMTKQATEQSGLTDAQVAKLKANPRMSKEEKRALADQILQQRTNLSLAEVEKLKTMDPAARRAWSQAYSAEMMAGFQARSPQEQAAAETEQTRMMRLTTLAKQQQEFLKQNNAIGTALQQKMTELDRDAQAVYARDIEPIDRRLAKCQEDLQQAMNNHQDEALGPLEKEASRIRRERNTALKPYCAQFTPTYCDLIRQYVTWAKGAQAGFVRYEEMENEKFKLQTNSPDNVLLESTGLMGIQEAGSCATLLTTVFKYRLFNDDQVMPD